jgi:hypothetical protein
MSGNPFRGSGGVSSSNYPSVFGARTEPVQGQIDAKNVLLHSIIIENADGAAEIVASYELMMIIRTND